ncbi:alanine--tRNA ligase [Patescibacteria group bacterium]|nr:alanine--tRNA ligase [Patescibacteria group bacterium]
MNARELCQKYRQFFESQDHKWIPSSPLIPEDDPSALFTSAGMHPLAPYLLGEVHPLGKRLANVQECLRTGDIEEVGDTYHHTWFEMLGHWSLGDYFKEEAIRMSYLLLTEKLKLDKNRLAFTVFSGNKNADRDNEAASGWLKLGVAEERIAFLEKDNWWELPGNSGPCGPCTEMFYWWPKDQKPPQKFNPADSCWLEIGNDVLMQYQKTGPGSYQAAKQKNIDNGTGVERTLAAINGFDDNYKTSIFWPIIERIQELSGKKYGVDKQITRAIRIVADHIRSAVFVIADGVVPSNKEQGYVVRCLLRRAIRQGNLFGIKQEFIQEAALAVLNNQQNYAGEYPELGVNKEKILSAVSEEEIKFERTINRGLREIEKIIEKMKPGQVVSGEQAFFVYESFGFPLEMIVDEVKEKGFSVDQKGFKTAQEEHRRKSQTAAKGRFKGGLSGYSTKMICYHTATHLLQAALKEILGNHVSQVGSNVTEKRLRFDFTHPRELTKEEISQVECLVNDKIKKNLPVNAVVMSLNEALAKGSVTVPGKSYPEDVKVYCVGSLPEKVRSSAETASLEVCGGPHAKSTGELGRFEIIKEQSSGSGKRRIYGILK